MSRSPTDLSHLTDRDLAEEMVSPHDEGAAGALEVIANELDVLLQASQHGCADVILEETLFGIAQRARAAAELFKRIDREEVPS